MNGWATSAVGRVGNNRPNCDILPITDYTLNSQYRPIIIGRPINRSGPTTYYVEHLPLLCVAVQVTGFRTLCMPTDERNVSLQTD